nr:hypothetical protein JOCKYQNQ_JOCKYQNQ_CDS_0015 [Autographiviridae sp.]
MTIEESYSYFRWCLWKYSWRAFDVLYLWYTWGRGRMSFIFTLVR